LFLPSNLWGKPFDHQDVKQVWFTGAHSDVGGSYPEKESGLSQIALEWMIREAVQHGLVIDQKRYTEVLGMAPAPVPRPEPAGPHPDEAEEANFHAPPDYQGRLHESLHGGWWIPEYLPKRYADPGDDFRIKLKIPRGELRFISDGAWIHHSVIQRIADPGLDYKPKNLPINYQIEQ